MKETLHATRSDPVNSRHGKRSGTSARNNERLTAARLHRLLFNFETARNTRFRQNKGLSSVCVLLTYALLEASN